MLAGPTPLEPITWRFANQPAGGAVAAYDLVQARFSRAPPRKEKFSMSPPTLRAELARAVRVVNLAFGRLNADEQERVHLIADNPLDVALVSGDRGKGLAQIECWRDRQLAAIQEVAGVK